MIHFFVGSHVKKPESGLFSDWIGNNTDDLLCSNWPKCRHPLVVVDFSPGGVRTTIAKHHGRYSKSDHLCQDGVE